MGVCSHPSCASRDRKIAAQEPLVEHQDYSDANAGLVPWGQYDADTFHLGCWTAAFKDNAELLGLLRGATASLPTILKTSPADTLSPAGRKAVRAAVLDLLRDPPAPTTPMFRRKRPATSGEKSAKAQKRSPSKTQ